MAVALPAPRRLVRGTVPGQLGDVLRAMRTEGLLFEQAWEAALAQITWPVSQRETVEWERALDGTQHAWRACYERWEPLPSERAVVGLVEALSRARG